MFEFSARRLLLRALDCVCHIHITKSGLDSSTKKLKYGWHDLTGTMRYSVTIYMQNSTVVPRRYAGAVLVVTYMPALHIIRASYSIYCCSLGTHERIIVVKSNGQHSAHSTYLEMDAQATYVYQASKHCKHAFCCHYVGLWAAVRLA